MAAASPVRVLLVDDYDPWREFARGLLEEAGGVVVEEAGDGSAALEILVTTTCDLVLMDFVMPGMNGVEATRQITARFPSVKVVGLTGTPDPVAHASFIDAGAVAVFDKAALADVVPYVRRAGPDGVR